MSQYIAGGLMMVLLVAITMLGLEAYAVYDAARMVDAALLESQLQLAADGGVSPAVIRAARRRVEAEGGDPARLRITGTRPGTPFGEPVTMEIVYEHPYRLPVLGAGSDGREAGSFRIRRRAVIMSGWEP